MASVPLTLTTYSYLFRNIRCMEYTSNRECSWFITGLSLSYNNTYGRLLYLWVGWWRWVCSSVPCYCTFFTNYILSYHLPYPLSCSWNPISLEYSCNCVVSSTITLLDVYGEYCKRMVLGKKIGKFHEFTNWGIVDPAPTMNELIVT